MRQEPSSHDSAEVRLDAKLSALDNVLKWVKALVVGAFVVGAWIATQQLHLAELDSRVQEIEAKLAGDADWKASTSNDISAIKQQTRDTADNMNRLLNRLDGKQGP